MLISFRAVTLGACLGTVFPLFAAAGANVGHEPLRCVPARGNAKVVATFKLPDSVTSARVYFRLDGQGSDYFLEMRRGDQDRYWALLPQVEDSAAALVYRVVARDGAGNSATTPAIRAGVSVGCPVGLSEEERRAARNIVLGLTEPGQNQNPVGFGCEGIVGQISPSGELRNVTPCSVVAGGKTAVPAGRDATPSMALTATSGGMQSTTAAACGNPDGLSTGGKGKIIDPPPPPPPPPPPSESRPKPLPN